jgi:hypothetical protein
MGWYGPQTATSALEKVCASDGGKPEELLQAVSLVQDYRGTAAKAHEFLNNVRKTLGG